MPRSRKSFSSARAWIAACALGLALFAGRAPLAAADGAADDAAAAELAEADRLEQEIDHLGQDRQYELAFPKAARVLLIRRQRLGPEAPATARAESDLGALYLIRGDLYRAEEPLRHAAQILEQDPKANMLSFSVALDNLSVFERKNGRTDRAIAVSERAIATLTALGAEAEGLLAAHLERLGATLGAMQQTDKALPLLDRALRLRDKRGETTLAIKVLISLGKIERDAGRAVQSAKHLEDAYARAQKTLGENHPITGWLLWQIGRFYHRDGNYPEAESFYQRALPVLESSYGPTNPDVGEFLADWSLLREAAGDIPRAVELRARSNDIEEDHIRVLLASGSDVNKKSYAAQLQRHLEDTVSLQASSGQRDPGALRLALTTVLRRKARALDALGDDLATLRAHLGPAEQRLLADLTRVRSALGTLMLGSPDDDPAAYLARHGALADEARWLEATISERSAELRVATSKVTLEAVQAAIPEGAVLVELLRYQPRRARAYSARAETDTEEKYIAYVLPRTGEPRWTYVPVNASEIDLVAQQLRARIQDTTSFRVVDAADRLDHLLMRRLTPLLGDAREVLISPDGALNTVPFGALVEDGHFLLERFAFTYLTSGRDLLRLGNRRPSRSGPVVFADPAYGEESGSPSSPGEGKEGRSSTGKYVAGRPRDQEAPPPSVDPRRVVYPRLLGTKAEAKAILQVVPGATLRQGAAATEAAVKAVHGPKFLHIATHGFFFSALEHGDKGDKAAIIVRDPLVLSGLALADANLHARGGEHGEGAEDGLLTAFEASALDLSGTELVVLSACETGMGQILRHEGVAGLRRALIVAGAETQVMSLWKVDDEATRDLMTVYYQELFRHGAGRSEALRRAQLAILQQRSTRHPFYWAAFITSGASGPLTPDERWTRPPAVAPGARGCTCALGGAPAPREGAAAWGLSGLALLALLARLGVVRRRALASRDGGGRVTSPGLWSDTWRVVR